MINWKQRYQQAHRVNQERISPSAVKDFGYLSTQYPKVDTANGLTRMILNFLTWNGWRATRVSSSGRIVSVAERQESGISLMTKKYIPGQTRRGAADISSTIQGRSFMFEIKIGKDKPSEWQLREQEIERRAGGEYLFISTPEQFFQEYDRIIDDLPF